VGDRENVHRAKMAHARVGSEIRGDGEPLHTERNKDTSGKKFDKYVHLDKEVEKANLKQA